MNRSMSIWLGATAATSCGASSAQSSAHWSFASSFACGIWSSICGTSMLRCARVHEEERPFPANHAAAEGAGNASKLTSCKNRRWKNQKKAQLTLRSVKKAQLNMFDQDHTDPKKAQLNTFDRMFKTKGGHEKVRIPHL